MCYRSLTVVLLYRYGLHQEGVADYGGGSESEKRRGRMSVLRLGARGGSRTSGVAILTEGERPDTIADTRMLMCRKIQLVVSQTHLPGVVI